MDSIPYEKQVKKVKLDSNSLHSDLNPPIRVKLTGIQIWIHCIRIRIQLFKQTLLTLFGIQIRIYSLGIQILVFIQIY